jgi:hypothetical protein
MVRLASLAGLMVLALLIAATGGWAALMLSVSGPGGDSARTALAGVAGMVTLVVIASLILNRWRLAAVSLWLLVLAGALAWWFAMKPSNDRDWLPNVARTPWATVAGDTVTVHNIRNFTYRTETDFTPAWYDKSYDLRKLEGIDIVASYWMGPDIAHVFVSFAFAGGDHLAMSIETRTEKGEGYSPSRVSSASTSCTTWWLTNATSLACAPTSAEIHPRMCTSTASRATPRAGARSSWNTSGRSTP